MDKKKKKKGKNELTVIEGTLRNFQYYLHLINRTTGSQIVFESVVFYGSSRNKPNKMINKQK